MTHPNRPKDYVVTTAGTLVHKRWANPDGSLKEGIELEKEQVRVELEQMAAKLLDLGKRLP